MVIVQCNECNHAWNSSAKGNKVTCSNCGAKIEVSSNVVAKGNGKGKSNGGSSFGVTNWGGFKANEGGFLSSWGGLK